jgi:hypothetical protein
MTNFRSHVFDSSYFVLCCLLFPTSSNHKGLEACNILKYFLNKLETGPLVRWASRTRLTPCRNVLLKLLPTLVSDLAYVEAAVEVASQNGQSHQGHALPASG